MARAVLVVTLLTLAALAVVAVPLTPSSGAPAAGPLRAVPGSATSGAPSSSSSAGPLVIVTPVLTDSPKANQTLTLVWFNVSSFPKGAALSITWVPTGTKSGATVTACPGAKTDSSGSYHCHYLIPPTAGGRYSFKATVGTKNAFTNFTVLPTLRSIPTRGPVDVATSVTGVAFGSTVPASTGVKPVFVNVTVRFNGVAVCPLVLTNLYGNFSCVFSLPPATGGNHTFFANDTKGNNGTAVFFVVAKVAVNPSYPPSGIGYGLPGTSVAFTGTGFSGNTSVAITWPGGTACVAGSSANGGFNCTYTLPMETPRGPFFFTGSDGTFRARAEFDVTYLSAFPVTGSAGGTVTFSGGGFSPFSTVTVSWGGGTVLTAPTNATGNFAPFLFTVPATPGGTYPFHAVDSQGLWANFALTIAPALLATPKADGPAGSTVIWNGTGFAPLVPVTVSWVGGSVCSATTDSVGNFSCAPFTIPNSTVGGRYNFTATDSELHSAVGVFTVTFLSVLPLNGPVGTAVTIAGGGFTPGQGVTVTLGAKTECFKVADANGSIACAPFKIPQSPAGPLSIFADDSLNETAVVAFTTVPSIAVTKPAPTVTPSGSLPPQGGVGTSITFTGTGYGASVNVSVDWFEGTACSNTTSPLGAFNCTFVLPGTPTGLYPFFGVDAFSNTALTDFQVVPTLVATPPGGNAGLSVALVASGFAAKSQINISSSLALACSGTTDIFGTFACSYSIPPIAKGNVTFTAFDSGGDQAKLLFPVGPHLAVSPTAAPFGVGVATVGASVLFTGTGFAASSALTLNWTTGTVCRVTTSSIGGFSCGYVVPSTSAGPHVFVATDSMKTPDTANATLFVLPTVVTNLSSGPVGLSVRFNGSGFSANSTVQVSGFGTPVCNGATGAFGSFVCSGPVPAAPFGNLTFSAVDLTTLSATAGFGVVANLTVSPGSGPVGTLVTFVGRGFAPASAARVTWSGGTVCSATTAANGTFACAAPLPPATAGSHAFTATDAFANSAGTTFSVTTSISAGLTATPSAGPPGTLVSFHGSGFSPGTTVNVTWALGLACTGLSDGTGGFDCTFTIPLSAPGGLYTFSGADSNGNSASATFVVTFLSAQPPHGPVGTSVTLSGGGFTASSSFSIVWPGGTVCTGTTTTSGGLGCSFVIPSVGSGSYNFTATDGSSVSATVAFQVTPVLAISRSHGPVHTVLSFSGSAFAPLTAYSLSYVGGIVCQGSTDGAGTFTCPFEIPPTPGGLYLFNASDGTGNSSTVTFVVTPSMAPAFAHGPVGSVVPFTGLGFDAGSSVSVENPTGVGCDAVTDASGTFSCNVSIGLVTGGSYSFVGTEGIGQRTATAAFTVDANLTVSPSIGPVGATLTFVATGFAGFAPIAIQGLTGAVCSGATSSLGVFACTFAAPTGLVGGNNSFSASDSLGDTATATLLVVPALTLSPAFGAPGTIFTLTGLGFEATGPMTVTWAGGTVCAVTTNASGDFACTFQIPLATVGGPYLFAATDGLGNRASATFTVTFLTPTPASGPVGTLITLNGGGFGPGAPYAVTGFGTSLCSGTTDSGGAFRCAFVLPASTIGSHLLTASDGGSTSATATVVVVPSLIDSPPTGPVGTSVTFSGNGFAAGLPVTVSWTSGVACTATTDGSGSFSCGFRVPSVATAVYQFSAVDSANNNASTTFDVALPATFNVTFTESGLPAGTNWTVSLNGVNETTNLTSVTFTEPNGAYTFTVRSTGFLGSPPSGTVTVAGGAVSAPVSFAPALYTVTFSETGLSGVLWSVTLGATTVSTTGPTLSFAEPNGTYNFTVNPVAGYTVSVASGQVTVQGASPATVPVVFSVVDYAVTFAASGLPTGQSWSVSLNGVRSSSTSTMITVLRPNGTYSYVFASAGFTPGPGGGTLTVNGAPLGPIGVAFAAANFSVTFQANGLVPGALWSVTFNGQNQLTTGPTLVFYSGNGNFSWTTHANGYKATTARGNVSVEGANPPPVNLTFTQLVYTVTFTETGLPAGSYWSVGVAGYPAVNQSTKSIAVQVPNGSYLVAFLPPNGYLPQPPIVILTVAGVNRAVNIQMVPFSQLVPGPPSTFLGYTGYTGYYIFAGILAGCAGGGGAAGYFLGRRATRKTLAGDFL